MQNKGIHLFILGLIALFVFSSNTWAQVDPEIKITQFADPEAKSEIKRGNLQIKSNPRDIQISIEKLGIKSKKNQDIWLAESLPTGTYKLTVMSMDRKFSYECKIDADQLTQVEIDITKNSFLQKHVTIKTKDFELINIVEDVPKFQGKHDLEYFRNYIQDRVTYPENAKNKHIKGVVYASFVVNKDGEVSNIKIIRGVSPELDSEVVRALKESPLWSPAVRRGKAVDISMAVPIKFK